MLAQIPDAATPTTIVGAFITIAVSLAFLIGWILRHVFMTTIPQTTKAFTDSILVISNSRDTGQAGLLAEQRAQREAHDKQCQEMYKLFRDETAAERRQCADQFQAMNAASTAMATSISEERRAIIASVNGHTSEAMAAYRHDLRGMIQEAVMGRELAAARAAAVREQVEEAKSGNKA